MKSLILVFVIANVYQMVNCHTYHIGDCPIVEPMANFDMSKFLGLWYAIEKTSTDNKCLTYNFTVGTEPGQYFLEQVSDHPVLSITSIDRYHYTGDLRVSAENPAKMTVKFPLSIAGKASFVIFMTDYENYAGVYTCQKLPASNRRSATLLSRKKTLDNELQERMRHRLSLFGVSPLDLSEIEQEKCSGRSPSATSATDVLPPKTDKDIEELA